MERAASNRPTTTSQLQQMPSLQHTTRERELGVQEMLETDASEFSSTGWGRPASILPFFTSHRPSAPRSPPAATKLPQGLNCTVMRAPVLLRRRSVVSTSQMRQIRSPPTEANKLPFPLHHPGEPPEKSTACATAAPLASIAQTERERRRTPTQVNTNDAPALAQAHSHTHTNTDRATHMCYTHLDVGPMLS
jgi:hypothetical protein